MPDRESISPGDPTVLLEGVHVRYPVVEDRVTSFKEFVLERLRSRPEPRELHALDGVTLAVAPGETLGVVGRNGAGKTTLLKVIAGVLTPSEGRVRTQGRVVPLLGVGAGFQPDLTGRENVFLALTMLGISLKRAAELFDEVVDFAELRDVIDRPIRQYSAGMVARLGFAVGTAERADLLLLDEVLAVGDERFQEKCLQRIGEVCSAGTTVLLVSHSAPAISHCRRAVWVCDGRVAADGHPGEVLADYRRGVSPDTDPSIIVPVEDESPRMPVHESPQTEPIDDAELVSALRRKCSAWGSPFHAFRVFSELREIALRRGVDFDRVLELGPSSSPLLPVCFAAAGANRVASTGENAPVTADELGMLKSYLAPVCGARWWRYSADVYSGDDLEAPTCWNEVDIESCLSIVERLPSLGSGRIPVADGSFSFVYSAGSLAHVADPEAAVLESARVVSPGGGFVHEILFSELTFADPLADLRYSEDEWSRRLLARRHTEGSYNPPPGVHRDLAFGHRWRLSDFVAAMERAGFVDISAEPVVILKHDVIDPRRLAEPFRSRSLEDLAVLVAYVSGRRG